MKKYIILTILVLGLKMHYQDHKLSLTSGQSAYADTFGEEPPEDGPPGDGGGGTTGGGGDDTDCCGSGNLTVNIWIDQIDPLTQPCLSQTVQFVANFDDAASNFGGNGQPSLSIYSDGMVPNGTAAQTSSTGYSDGHGGYNVSAITMNLNTNILNSASEEYQVAVLLHEMNHAENAYLGLSEGDDHERMTGDVLEFQSDLMSIFPDLDSNDAYFLAWTGLQGTDAFSELDDGTIEDIYAANTAYQDVDGIYGAGTPDACE